MQLWEQGDARVVINRGEAPGKPRVIALAFETPDPDAAAARAEALLAPACPAPAPGRGRAALDRSPPTARR